jgi:hypothetical protein
MPRDRVQEPFLKPLETPMHVPLGQAAKQLGIGKATLSDLTIFRAKFPPTSIIIEQAGARACRGMTMIKKALFEELI